MNLLQIAQEFCLRTGLPKPLAIATSKDAQNLQYMGLLNEILDNLAERKTWTALQIEAIFTTVASEDQGSLTTLAPQGFQHFLNNTMYDRTLNRPIIGPVSPEEWQGAKALANAFSQTSFRMQGNHLYLTPAPTAGRLIAFEYKGDLPVVDNSALPVTSGKAYFSRDDDTCLYPDKLLILGLRWNWKREKGLRNAEEFRAFELAIANFAGNDGGAKSYNLAGESSGATLSVADQSWPL